MQQSTSNGIAYDTLRSHVTKAFLILVFPLTEAETWAQSPNKLRKNA